jgi:hypothetical protein
MEDDGMGNLIVKGGKKVLIEGGKVVAEMVAPDLLNFGAKVGTEFIEKQKNLVKIPDLKDVHIDEALRILKDELNLTPTPAVANPNIAYADESENEVMYTEPRFGSRINPKTTVKVYFLTQEVIEKSKELLGSEIKEFKIPEIIGLNVYEAREDLEGLGLKVAEKLEKPNEKLLVCEDGQVTRVTYPNDKKIGSKLKTGERIWLYYVDEEVIYASKAIKDEKDHKKQENIEKVNQVVKNAAKGMRDGAVGAPQNIVKNIKKPFAKKNDSKGISEEQ